MKEKITICLMSVLLSVCLYSQPKWKNINHVTGSRKEETHLGSLSEVEKYGNLLFYSATTYCMDYLLV
jgi:hypothetical protein